MTTVTRNSLTALLQNDKIAMHVVGRALVHLLNRQNVDEQIEETTKYHNMRGFCPMDARMGTSMAKQYQSKGFLSEKQINYWRVTNVKGVMRLAKYHAQLNEEAQKKVK